MKIHQVANATRIESALGAKIDPCFIKPPCDFEESLKFVFDDEFNSLTVNVPDALSEIVVWLASERSKSMIHPDDHPNSRTSHNQRNQNEIPNNFVEWREQTSSRC